MSEGRMQKKLALVVGAGAVKCAAALGLWKRLREEGIGIDLYVGCSGGSLYTAAMATCNSLEEATEQTLSLWNRSVMAKRNRKALLSAALPGVFKFDERFALIDDSSLNDRLLSVFGERRIEEGCAPLKIVAADLGNGEAVVMEEGRLFDALRASIAIPYILPAWQVNGRWLVDGSYVDPLPVDVAIREGAGIILAMGFESPYPRRIKSLSRYAFHLNSVMTNNLLRANFAFHNLAHHAEIIPILPDFGEEINLFDTEKLPFVIQKGEEAMGEQIEYLKKLL
jgi:NTE family protein